MIEAFQSQACVQVPHGGCLDPTDSFNCQKDNDVLLARLHLDASMATRVHWGPYAWLNPPSTRWAITSASSLLSPVIVGTHMTLLGI